MDYKKYVINVAGKDISFETGKLCGQSNGSCLVRSGDTVVMVNVTMSAEPKPGQDFFPLSVEYQEKMYSIGKIPGGFKKRAPFFCPISSNSKSCSSYSFILSESVKIL